MKNLLRNCLAYDDVLRAQQSRCGANRERVIILECRKSHLERTLVVAGGWCGYEYLEELDDGRWTRWQGA